MSSWTGELVINRLEAAFRMHPNAAMFSACSDLPSEGMPIEGTDLIQATAVVLGLDSPSRTHLLYHARARSAGKPITKLCQTRSWKPATHYDQVTAASVAVAEWLNARSMGVPRFADLSTAKRRVGRPPTLGRRLGGT